MSIKKIENYFDVFLGVSRFVDENNNKSKVAHDVNYIKHKIMRMDTSKILISSREDFTESVGLFAKELDKSNFIKKGDIVVKLMFPLKFIYIDFKIEDNNYLIPSQYCIIRKKSNSINPIDLWAYLNNSDSIKKIISKKEGNNLMNFVKISYIKEISYDDSSLSNLKTNLFYKLTKLTSLIEKKKILIDKYKKIIRY
ncbi:hypothetical protein [Malacoplasma iowae]|uniref:Type I restriction system DNA specificity subunit n=1 Tax=Malacoplasma iowae DK-CPA TaxID=1394179 RepID=A0A084U4T0_MALIO|nr:hypothetical protein [Malacoplasma iowae]KFB07966.1 type I restriction system DNA specificity subunit [Malacoplasma iowae DK-CPA]WPL41377.1 hypothetical protein QX184_02110 [Malacoplasma iowae]